MLSVRRHIAILIYSIALFLSVKAQSPSFSAKIDNQPLSTVLVELGRNQGVIIAFDASKLRTYRVSLRLEGASLAEALDQLLRNTPFTYILTSSGQVIIQQQKGDSTKLSQPERVMPALWGKIADLESNDPLPYASVRVKDSNVGTTADEAGYFRLRDVPHWADSLIISYLGYGQQMVAIPRPYPTHRLEIRLGMTEMALADVVIEEGSDQVVKMSDGANEIRLNPEKVHALSGLGEPDVIRALQWLPGVGGVKESASSLSIRGGNPQENLFLLDGITVYQPGHFFGNFSAFNSQAIKDLTLLRGGFDTKYGGRVSGIIDMTGRPDQLTEPKIRLGANIMSANFLAETPFANKKGSISLAARRSFSDILRTDFFTGLFENSITDSLFHESRKMDTPIGLTTQPVFNFWDINAKATYRPGTHDFLTFTFFQSQDKLRYNWADRTDSSTVFSYDENIRLVNRGLSLNWSHQWSQQLYQKINLAYSGFKNDYGFTEEFVWDEGQSSSQVLQFNEVRDLSLRIDQEWKPETNQKLAFGTHFSGYQIDYLTQFDSIVGNPIRQQSLLAAAYAQYDRKIGKRLDISLGTRISYFGNTNLWYNDPRVSARYQLNDHFSAKAVWGRYTQVLNRSYVNNPAGVGEDFWLLSVGDSIPALRADHFIAGLSFENEG
ncbi:MAG: TonB-dependent receptor, partial [Bacteroidota bacterium]